MKKNVILMSHGRMAAEIMNSARMILGENADYPTISMEVEDGIEEVSNKLDVVLKEFGKNKEILIIVDLLGGTPCNVALLKASEDKRIKVLTGLNLSMVLESYFDNSDNLISNLYNVGIKSIQMPVINNSDDNNE